MNIRQKFARITDWMQISGMSRTGTYRAIASGELKAVKLNNTTMVVVEPGLAWMESLPPADIKLNHRNAA